jgi:acyl-coenzyme A thioesterase PaaI-like protein
MRISLKDTFYLRAFSLAKVPLLFLANPSVISLSSEECVIQIPFKKRNKNHLGSLYFGALCIGADAAGGMIAMKVFDTLKDAKGSLIFKDFQAKFLKRAEGDTVFTCKDGPAIQAAVQKAYESSERVDLPVHVTATVPALSPDAVAEFVLTLSLKVKRK